MSEELVKQLSSYKAQLQQVEVALSTDTDNEDLLKLQKDLQVRVVLFHCVGLMPLASCSGIIVFWTLSSASTNHQMFSILFSVAGSYWLDKGPPKLTAREYIHHQWLRNSPRQARLEDWGSVYGCLESGRPVSIIVCVCWNSNRSLCNYNYCNTLHFVCVKVFKTGRMLFLYFV